MATEYTKECVQIPPNSHENNAASPSLDSKLKKNQSLNSQNALNDNSLDWTAVQWREGWVPGSTYWEHFGRTLSCWLYKLDLSFNAWLMAKRTGRSQWETWNITALKSHTDRKLLQKSSKHVQKTNFSIQIMHSISENEHLVPIKYRDAIFCKFPECQNFLFARIAIHVNLIKGPANWKQDYFSYMKSSRLAEAKELNVFKSFHSF